MNPPFTKQQDVDHVTKAFSLLRPGGKVVAITSTGFLFRENKKSVHFRELVNANGYFEKLPPETFKASGTLVNTAMIVLHK